MAGSAERTGSLSHCGTPALHGEYGRSREETRAFARQVLAEDLERAGAIGAEFLVVHPGSHAGAGREAGRRRILATLTEAFLPYPGPTCLLLETMAGQGSEVGTLEDLEFFLTELGRPPTWGSASTPATSLPPATTCARRGKWTGCWRR